MSRLLPLLLVLALWPLPAAVQPVPPQLVGLPGVDGAGSVRIVWEQTSAANYVVATRVRADGSQQVLFVSERVDDRPVPYYPPIPSYQGKVWRLYMRSWAPGDTLEVVEEQREFKRLRWRQTWGPETVQWWALLPVVVSGHQRVGAAPSPRSQAPPQATGGATHLQPMQPKWATKKSRASASQGSRTGCALSPNCLEGRCSTS